MTFATFVSPLDNGGVGFAFTDRLGGVSAPPFDSLNFAVGEAGSGHELRKNVRILSAGIGCQKIALCSQVHGCSVVLVDPGYPWVDVEADQWIDHALPEADAMVATLPGVGLAIRVADCVPVLMWDEDAAVIAAVHAGRVGLLAGVVTAALAAMGAHGATRISAVIGPHICPGCYEVPDAMASDAWRAMPATRARSRKGTSAIDLGAGVHAVLDAHHVTPIRMDPCTSCDPAFFSHRRDAGRTGRQVGVIWRKTDGISACFPGGVPHSR